MFTDTRIDEAGYSVEQHLSEHQYLTFWIDGQLFAIPASDVAQIVGMQQITPVPEYPPYAKGIINLRGEIIPVIDVRLRFHRNEADYGERTCIIIVSIKEQFVGFIVDTVEEVSDIDDTQISPPPKVSGDITNVYLNGVAQLEGKIILLVDTERVLNENELSVLNTDGEETDEGDNQE